MPCATSPRPPRPRPTWPGRWQTLAVGSEGTRRLLELARAHGARFLWRRPARSTGTPTVHPQVESYRGNVDPTGPRSVYDEAKRFAESLTMAMHRAHGVDVGIARIFNTYGPRLSPGDGRVVSNFVVQALRGEPLTVYGDGSQTRSFCYVEDEVEGCWPCSTAISPARSTSAIPTSAPCSSWRDCVLEVTGSSLGDRTSRCPTDDPTRRCPDITLARARPGLGADDRPARGPARTVEYFSRTGGTNVTEARWTATCRRSGRTKSLTVIVPVYNERKTVAEIIRRIRAVELPGSCWR